MALLEVKSFDKKATRDPLLLHAELKILRQDCTQLVRDSNSVDQVVQAVRRRLEEFGQQMRQKQQQASGNHDVVSNNKEDVVVPIDQAITIAIQDLWQQNIVSHAVGLQLWNYFHAKNVQQQQSNNQQLMITNPSTVPNELQQQYKIQHIPSVAQLFRQQQQITNPQSGIPSLQWHTFQQQAYLRQAQLQQQHHLLIQQHLQQQRRNSGSSTSSGGAFTTSNLGNSYMVQQQYQQLMVQHQSQLQGRLDSHPAQTKNSSSTSSSDRPTNCKMGPGRSSDSPSHQVEASRKQNNGTMKKPLEYNKYSRSTAAQKKDPPALGPHIKKPDNSVANTRQTQHTFKSTNKWDLQPEGVVDLSSKHSAEPSPQKTKKLSSNFVGGCQVEPPAVPPEVFVPSKGPMKGQEVDVIVLSSEDDDDEESASPSGSASTQKKRPSPANDDNHQSSTKKTRRQILPHKKPSTSNRVANKKGKQESGSEPDEKDKENNSGSTRRYNLRQKEQKNYSLKRTTLPRGSSVTSSTGKTQTDAVGPKPTTTSAGKPKASARDSSKPKEISSPARVNTDPFTKPSGTVPSKSLIPALLHSKVSEDLKTDLLAAFKEWDTMEMAAQESYQQMEAAREAYEKAQRFHAKRHAAEKKAARALCELVDQTGVVLDPPAALKK